MMTRRIETFRLLGATDPEGKEWEVCLIEEGISLNNVYYPADVLKKAAKIFEGVKAYALKFGDTFDHLPDAAHRAAPGGVIANIVGWFSDVRFGEIPGEKKRGLIARFHIADNAKWLRDLMRDAWRNGMKKLLGFSIDAEGELVPAEIDGMKVSKAVTLNRANSVDVVSHPAAGGQFLRLVASLNNPHQTRGEKMLEKLLRLIESIDSTYLVGKDRDRMSESDSVGLLRTLYAEYEAKTLEQKLLKSSLERLFGYIEDSKRQEAIELLETLLEGKFPHKTEKPTEEGKTEDEKKADLQKSAKSDDEDEEEKKKKKGKYGEYPELEKKKESIESIENELKQTLEELRRQKAVMESQVLLESRLSECRRLPAATIARLREQFKGIAFSADDLEKAIRDEEAYLDRLSESGTIRKLGKVEVGNSELDIWNAAMDGLWEGHDMQTPDGKTIPRFRSFREAYRVIARVNGEPDPHDMIGLLQYHVPGFVKSSNYWTKTENRLFESRRRLIESTLTVSDWGQVFGDSITRKMIRGYARDDLTSFYKIVSEKSTGLDFRTQRRIRIGGFGTLSAVSEGNTYTEFSVPTDEETTYSVAKYGNLFSVTLEALTNDDLGAIKKLAGQLDAMGRAAARTIYKSIWDMFANNVDQSGTTIATGGRGNYGTTALSGSTMDTIRASMREMTAYGDTSETLGDANIPKYLVVPSELEPIANAIAKSDFRVQTSALYSTGTAVAIDNQYPNLHKGIEPIVVSYWTDADNFWVFADPAKVPIIELGFFGPSETPEMFVADSPSATSYLYADKTVYKMRFIFGYALLDYRGVYGSIV